ncbi:MAG: hypothetical protein UZ22_OP11002000992 [Microgenomates bacterium OLB23]|nr:MAG: hypothetical protein UZ22_OP11002000992 [Microgenomates bacterium OLB23]
MALETTFYIIGIIALSLWIVIAVSCILLVLYVKHQVRQVQKSFVGKITSLLRNKKTEVFAAIGLTAAQMLLNKLKKSMRNKEV